MSESFTGTELTCREIIDFVLAYLDGELPARERAIFDRHLSVCPDCVNYLNTYQATLGISKLAAGTESEGNPILSELVQAILAARKES